MAQAGRKLAAQTDLRLGQRTQGRGMTYERMAALRSFTLHYGQALAWQSLHHEGYKIVSMFAGTGGGKALALDTPIPTPSGWTTMGELRVGDRVLDEQGRPCRVTYATPVQYERTCYEVVFSDGSTIVADADHRWHTWTYRERKNLSRRIDRPAKRRRSPQTTPQTPPGQVRTTAQIAATLFHHIGKVERANHSIPVAQALQLPPQNLPVDPYVLGVWLGDGHARESILTCNDPETEILGEVEAAGYEVRKHKAAYLYGMGATQGLHAVLRGLGVLNNKHVPALYLRGSIEQRQALLAGLMDTDGYVKASGGCLFYNTSQRLADAVEELAVSLGYQVRRTTTQGRYNGKDYRQVYVVAFTPHGPVFRLPRKLARQRLEEVRATQHHRYIVDVRPVASVPVRCITVDSPSHLYLAGRSMIPTHNTWSAPRLLYPFLREGMDKKYLFVEPTWRMVKRIMVPECVPFFDSFHLGHMHYGDMVYLLRGGGAIYFGSVDNPNSLQGVHIDGAVWADEVGLYSEDAFDVLMQRRSAFQAPMLNTSTPYTLPWAELRLSKPASHPIDRHTYRCIQFPSYWNPHYNREEYFRLKRTWPKDKFERLMRGEFTRIGGLMFDAFNEQNNLATIYPLDGRRLYFKHPREGERVVELVRVWGAQDWGWSDPGCHLTAGMDALGRVYVFDEYYESLVPFNRAAQDGRPSWTDHARKQHRRWGYSAIYCDPAMPEYITSWQGTKLPALKANHDIEYGADLVNQAFMPQGDGSMGLYISTNNCPNLVRTIGTYVRRKQPGTDIYLPKPADHQEDHACLVAGTLVETIDGPRPIETIIPGTLVLTRQGYQPVVAAGMTKQAASVKTVELSNGATLTGTGNHPVWVEGRGWSVLDTLRYGDIMCQSAYYLEDWSAPCQDHHPATARPLSSTASLFAAGQHPSDGQTVCTSPLEAASVSGAWADSTRRYGERPMALSQRAAISTTATATPSIMTSPTWNVWLRRTTTNTTPARCEGDQPRLSDWRGWRRPSNLPRGGTAQRPEGPGIAPTLSRHGRGASQRSASASSVASHSSRSPVALLTASVVTTAKAPGDAPRDWITSRAPASDAASPLPAIGTTRRDTAPVSVVVVRDGSKPQPVYNLTVANATEYFAGGVLVHNCDTARYLIVGDRKKLQPGGGGMEPAILGGHRQTSYRTY